MLPFFCEKNASVSNLFPNSIDPHLVNILIHILQKKLISKGHILVIFEISFFCIPSKDFIDYPILL